MNTNIIKKAFGVIGLVAVLMAVGLAFNKMAESIAVIDAENTCIAEQIADGVSRSDIESSGECK